MNKNIETYIEMVLGILSNDYPTASAIIDGNAIKFFIGNSYINKIVVISNGDILNIVIAEKQFFAIDINDDDITDAIIEPLNWILG